jgi:hypothetical protein
MDLDTFIIAVFCVIDAAVPRATAGRPMRQRGPQPALADSEVLTMEVVGEYLGLAQDSAVFGYFRQHYVHFFPALGRLHRTTFVRQAANLWALKERVWQELLARAPHDPTFAIVDSFPLPVCQFARAYRCRRFPGAAAYGKDTLVRQTFYGFRVHVRLEWPGVITRVCIAPANVHELEALPALAEGTHGTLVGERNYWSPKTRAEWQPLGVELLAPYRSAKRDPHPRWSAPLSRVRQPHRYRLRSTGRALHGQAGVGTRPVALKQSPAAQGPAAYARHPAQRRSRQPAVAARSVGGLSHFLHALRHPK